MFRGVEVQDDFFSWAKQAAALFKAEAGPSSVPPRSSASVLIASRCSNPKLRDCRKTRLLMLLQQRKRCYVV